MPAKSIFGVEKKSEIAKAPKREREKRVLLGLVELYIETAKPVGSHTLKDHGFGDLSSATIRNYFVALEEAGYVCQQHISGGRIPTPAAFKLYANECLLEEKEPLVLDATIYKELVKLDRPEIGRFLQRAIELLGEQTQMAVFCASPRFDQDGIDDVRFVRLDEGRSLAVLISTFGLVQTQVLYHREKISIFSLHRIEEEFRWRLKKTATPPALTDIEAELAREFYNEVMVRYLISYSNFTEEDVYQAGFSRLLHFPEFGDAVSLAQGLALFESPNMIRYLLRGCLQSKDLRFWIGDDLQEILPQCKEVAVLGMPYQIDATSAGAIGVLGPMRMPYRQLIGQLKAFSTLIGKTLSENVHRFHLSYRRPETGTPFVAHDSGKKTQAILLEDKR